MKKDTKGIGKLHDLNLRILSMPFSEALVEVMDANNIKVEQLEKRSLLNKKTISRYRCGYTKHTKVSVVQLCLGMQCHISTSQILLFKAGYVLGSSYEDVVYSLILENVNALDIYTANELIASVNNTLTFREDMITPFSE